MNPLAPRHLAAECRCACPGRFRLKAAARVQIDFHTWLIRKDAALSTLLVVGTGLSFSGQSDLVQAIRQSSQQNPARVGDQLVSRNLQVQPTITIRPGAPARLIVHRDLILVHWRE